MIQIESLTASLGDAPILNGIDAVLPRGALTALVGPNGAGKSTLLSVLGRLTPMTGGSVRLDGADLAQIPSRDLARRLSVLRQDTVIATRLTVEDLAGFGRYPHSQGRLTPEDRDIVRRCLALVDLEPLAGRHLDTLSGGQRQRALIAMALAQQTEVLLLDEPLNNLDLAHARRVMNVAAEEARAGKTVVVVLHDLTIAARFADHVVAMKDGRIHDAGPPPEVMSAASLGALYECKVEVHEIGGHRVVMPI
ncbi:ATP-binding cassette domain-containing protein [Roseicyclus sp. F158]|uniref:ATP-binding cassette domain-containing protein n=1 Tax=Tropicimonas omnivorans TaxID=3075590 RepID=A0ABU3DFJ9_9RHOB|nr:ATP-binding cassette domain-containing protein [Roseicyclus sp. F158]MDT0682457.1 ATP-binding cassette domain-containing protein [Roseicyclus sp. F158]